VDGDWIKLSENCMWQRCCSCGLYHFWEFEMDTNGLIRLRATQAKPEDIPWLTERWATK
jgi:hypothetical protein